MSATITAEELAAIHCELTELADFCWKMVNSLNRPEKGKWQKGEKEASADICRSRLDDSWGRARRIRQLLDAASGREAAQ